MSDSLAPPRSGDALVLSALSVTASTFASTEVSATVRPGELLLVTGPIGAGKSLLAEVLAGVERPGVVRSGSVRLGEAPLTRAQTALAPEDFRLAVLPTDLVGPTLLEAALHAGARTRAAAHSSAARQLHWVDLRDASRCYNLQFRELSSGERRRATLALALIQRPPALIADGLFGTLDDEGREAARRALGAYLGNGGRVIAFERSERHLRELASTTVRLGASTFKATRAPGSEELVEPPKGRTLLEVSGLGAARGRRGWFFKGRKALAVDGSSLDVRKSEIVCVVGENASGKTSLLEVTAGLVPASFGQVMLGGEDLTQLSERRLRPLRRRMQLVFQEAGSALSPQKTVREHLEEALALVPRDKRETRGTASSWLARVGMPLELLDRVADELSSGEAQRVELARRLAVRPELVLLDAPHVAGLGDEGQSSAATGPGPLDAILKFERAQGASFLIAEPDVATLGTIADRVGVLLSGRIVELGPTSSVLERPMHPYTRLFLDSASHGPTPESSSGPKSSRPQASLPSATQRARRQLSVLLEGARTEPRRPSRGCPFVTRCPKAVSGLCDKEEPQLAEAMPGSKHKVACYRPN
jgi:oligopeptide transport system ATP-binding protein